MPVMDWLISQIKYYSGYDAFPFVIKKGADINEVLKDLSTSYGTVLYLDDKEVQEIPENILFLRQQKIAALAKSELTDVEKTAHSISYLIQNNVKGEPTDS